MNQLQEQQAGGAGARIPTQYQDTDKQNDNAVPDVAPITSDGAMLDKALALLEAGFSVIPLGAYGETPPDHFVRLRCDGDIEKARAAWPKTPRIQWKKLQTEPATEHQVRTWWTTWPDANIGIATGRLIVVDGDSDETCAWIREHLTHTPWRVRTGKGFHFYYAENPSVEVKNSANPEAKLDTRGLGGYVVAAGSIHSSGAHYENDVDQDWNRCLADLPMLQPVDISNIDEYRSHNLAVAADKTHVALSVGNLVGFNAVRFTQSATGEPVAEGGRNNAAASLAGKYLQQGLSLRDIQRLLTGWNDSNDKPLSAGELNTTIASVTRTHMHNHPDAAIALEVEPPPTRTKGRAPPTFPEHLLNVPGLVGDVARYINESSRKPQPLLAVGAALTFCGAIMGRKVCTETDLRTNLYIIGVADSGSGKEAARGGMKRLLNEVGRPNIVGCEDLASDAGLFAAVWREPSCILLIDEIGRFWQAVTAKNAPQYLKNIAGALLRYTGSANGTFPEKAHADMAEKDLRIIKQPNLCLYGTTVPGRLFEGLHVNDIVDGLMPRFLVLHSDDPDPPIQLGMNNIPPAELVDRIRAWVNKPVNAFPTGANIADLEPNPLPVHASFHAKEVYAKFEIKNRARRAKTRGTGLDAMWARADEHAAKLGLIVACGRKFENPTIEVDDAQWACAFVEFVFERSIAEMGIHVSDNEYERNLKVVAHYLKEVGQVDKSTLARKFQRIKKQPMDEILAHFYETGDVSFQVKETGTKGRPPTIVTWLFNSENE